MTQKYGIEVFEILDNGNLLNAVYTNTGLFDDKLNVYHIDNEIAIKISTDNEGIEGQYNCRFIEKDNSLVNHCTLIITKKGSAYLFQWRSDTELFEGIGLMVGKNHIAVSYVEINQL